MTKAFNYQMFYARSEVMDAIIHFAQNDPNTKDQDTYYLGLLKTNLPKTGNPTLFTRPITGKSKRLSGAIALVALWNDDESSVYAYPQLCADGIKWFDNYLKEQVQS